MEFYGCQDIFWLGKLRSLNFLMRTSGLKYFFFENMRVDLFLLRKYRTP